MAATSILIRIYSIEPKLRKADVDSPVWGIAKLHEFLPEYDAPATVATAAPEINPE